MQQYVHVFKGAIPLLWRIRKKTNSRVQENNYGLSEIVFVLVLKL